MLKAGVLHGLVDVVFGDLHPSILYNLQCQESDVVESDSTCRSRHCVHAMDVETWWSGINALHNLILKCSSAKELFDDCMGVHSCTKLLLPFIRKCCSSSRMQYQYMGVAISDFILELSVNGGLSSSTRPFKKWSKASVLRNGNDLKPNAKSSISDRMMTPFASQFAIHSSVSLVDFSSVYFLKNSSYQHISACMMPHPIFLNPSFFGFRGCASDTVARSSSFCQETKTFLKSEHGHAMPPAGLGRGLDVSDNFDDRSSTGRGSFTVPSATHLSLHGMSRVYSHSTLYTPTPSVQTPTPSVTGETTQTFEEYGVGYGNLKLPLPHQAVSQKAGGDDVECYAGVFLPLLSALRWGLGHRRDILLQIVYETLLLRAGNSDLEKNSDFKPQNTGQPMSLRQQSIQQYLQSFVSDENILEGERASMQKRTGMESGILSISSGCVFRSMSLVVNLLSLCVVLCATEAEGEGVVPGNVLRIMSHLIDGNPLNAAMINETNLTLNLSRFVFHGEKYFPRNAICHILSQLYSYKVTPPVFNTLVEIACSVDGKRGSEKPMLLIPSKGISQRIQVETDLDDIGCQVLFMLGRAIERAEVPSYAYFSQCCPFLNRVVLPPCNEPPSCQVGITVFMWLRIGSMCDAPNATLLQFSMDHPLRHGSLNEEVEMSNEDVPAANSIDFYFRVVHQTCTSNNVKSGMHQTDSSVQFPEAASVASATTAVVEEVSKSYLQLCVSYSQCKSVLDKECKLQADQDRRCESTLGLDGMHVILFRLGDYYEDV